MTGKEFETRILKTIATEDATQLKKCVDEQASYCFKDSSASEHNSFPEQIFNFILNLMKQQQFLMMQGSWHLLMIFEYDWGLLSVSQTERLLSALEAAYTAFADWMSWFVISEILGEYFMDERSFQALCRLMNSAADDPRSFVPHGLEHIAKNNLGRDLAQKALAELLVMREDSSSQVRHEVNLSLQRLGVSDKVIDG